MEKNSECSPAKDEKSDSAANPRVSGPNTAEHRNPSDSSSEEDEGDESSKGLSEEAKKEEEVPASSSFKPMASHSRKSLLSTLTRHVHI